MEGRTLAIAAFNTKLDDDFQIAATDPAERAKIEAGMRRPRRASRATWIRSWPRARWTPTRSSTSASCAAGSERFVEMSYQTTGYRRVKNPRIWSLHDLAALTEPRA